MSYQDPHGIQPPRDGPHKMFWEDPIKVAQKTAYPAYAANPDPEVPMWYTIHIPGTRYVRAKTRHALVGGSARVVLDRMILDGTAHCGSKNHHLISKLRHQHRIPIKTVFNRLDWPASTVANRYELKAEVTRYFTDNEERYMRARKFKGTIEEWEAEFGPYGERGYILQSVGLPDGLTAVDLAHEE